MSVALPREPIYYYEASFGDFRLVYYMPVEQLQQLASGGQIAAAAVEDFPDGVDLGCTVPDFAEFEALYGYRPPLSPDALRAAFLALYSSTRDWQDFHGSGFIPAEKLESLAREVVDSLSPQMTEPVAKESLFEPETAQARRRRLAKQAAQAEMIQAHLRAMGVAGVRPDLPLDRQELGPIAMDAGESAVELFLRLQKQQRR